MTVPSLPSTNDIIPDLKSLLGDDAVQKPQRQHVVDRRGLISAPALAIVYPKSTHHVSLLANYCYDNTIGMIPQGGNTGNCAGSVPNPDIKFPCIIVSLERMNTIEHICPHNNIITVQAGCILNDIYDACSLHNRSFPVTLAPADRVQAGGLLATNAGGLNVIHYGMTRHNVLGLEYVLPNGTIVNNMNTLTKNALGIDANSIVIGSEGTLAIITRAVFKLHPPIPHKKTGLIQFNSIQDGINILRDLQHKALDIYAFEVWNDATHTYATHDAPDSFLNTLPPSPWYGLVDILHDNPPDVPNIQWLPESHAQTAWQLRKNFSYALGKQGHIAHDIAIPLTHWEDFINDVTVAVNKATSGFLNDTLIPSHFGHLGDGNLHLEFVRPDSLSMDDFRALTPVVNQAVYGTVQTYGGTPASEHGVGQTKRDLMKTHLCPNTYELMKQIKNTFDSKGIMNPGKIF